MGSDLLGDDRVAIIGGGEEAAEFFLRVGHGDRKQEFALVAHEKRAVVRQELREQGQHEQRQEQP